MRNIVVTGSSRGIGLAIARKLVAGGDNVIAIARKQSGELQELAQETEASATGGLCFAPYDLGDIDGIPDFVRGLRQKFAALHGLVNNAGIGTDGLLTGMRNVQIEELIRVNVLSPIMLTKYVARSMMNNGGGSIVNISSVIASTGYSGLSVYGATKSASIGFTRSLARELGRLGVTVNAVAPGFIDTALTKDLGPEEREKVARRSALGRLPQTDDVANAVEFLLSDKARNITGTVVTVDAGSTA
jgi:3-oxoacyl-[acyl-carrier protein] reductase